MKKGGYFTDYSILGRSPLFRGIPAGDFGVLLEHLKTETRSYKKGDLICHAGEHTNALGIVLTGSVTIESDDIFGNRSVLDKVGPGQVFAETYACVPNEPMLVNVAAAENCTVLFLKTAQILSPCAVNCGHHGKLIENLLLVNPFRAAKAAIMFFGISILADGLFELITYIQQRRAEKSEYKDIR